MCCCRDHITSTEGHMCNFTTLLFFSFECYKCYHCGTEGVATSSSSCGMGSKGDRAGWYARARTRVWIPISARVFAIRCSPSLMAAAQIHGWHQVKSHLRCTALHCAPARLAPSLGRAAPMVSGNRGECNVRILRRSARNPRARARAAGRGSRIPRTGRQILNHIGQDLALSPANWVSRSVRSLAVRVVST